MRHHDKFSALVDWIKELHVVKEENGLIRNIVDQKIAEALKCCKLFFKVWLSIFLLSLICALASISTRYIYIFLPNFEADSNYITYQLLQAFFLSYAVVWTCCADASLVFIGIYILFFMKIINAMIKNLDSAESKENRSDLLIQIVKKHVKLLEILNMFNDAIAIISLIQLVMSTIIFLSLFFAFQVYKEFFMYTIIPTMMIQLALLCIFGEMIRTENENIFQNLYQTNWYEFSVKEQKIVLLMMMNSCNEIGLKAAGMYDISLVTLVQITKLSFSYSAIILTFYK
ncbi:odorant receptor 85b-like [Phlebotomus argentipes]|uniref:odorant receptor 85b-like n=1 Tax=Phlebotomus argentipes TaxID=94469 RepID=UPI002892E102|nr:odorant receptor 85b-like [Phlebotomus argentipes]